MNVTLSDVRFDWHAKPVLSIDSLQFPAARTTAILGPNGAGKTTLLRLISGLARPVGGRITLGDHLVQGPLPAFKHVAFAFQKPVFLKGTVHDNLDLGLRLRGTSRADRQSRIAEIARDCEITHLLGRPALELSQGEAQRVNLARTLALRAPITLLDEPLAGFDPGLKSRLLDDLPRLFAAWATTVLVVTHNRDEALWLADHLVILTGGRVLTSGPSRELVAQPPDPETAELLGYTLMPLDGELAGIPPGALKADHEDRPLTMLVERVVDMGSQREVLGAVGQTRARAVWIDNHRLPEQGERVGLRVDRFVKFPA
jgi:ABC-type sugar transport system ATPase subunit